MKLRYAFPLMLAAAAAGGAIVHYRAARESTPAVRPNETTESRYRLIADAIGSSCWLGYDPDHRDVSEVFTDFTRSVESDWIRETQRFRDSKEIARVGPRLKIKTKAKEVEFLDVGYLCHDSDVQIHSYKARLERIGWHVVGVRFYEGADDSILISPETGERVRTFEHLLESPSGTRLAAYAPEEGEGSRGIEIFRVEGARLISELKSGDALGARHPLFATDYVLEIVGWIDDESLLLMMHQHRQAKLRIRNGQWTFEYLSP